MERAEPGVLFDNSKRDPPGTAIQMDERSFSFIRMKRKPAIDKQAVTQPGVTQPAVTQHERKGENDGRSL